MEDKKIEDVIKVTINYNAYTRFNDRILTNFLFANVSLLRDEANFNNLIFSIEILYKVKKSDIIKLLNAGTGVPSNMGELIDFITTSVHFFSDYLGHNVNVESINIIIGKRDLN